jgi:hypothetical protein
LAARWKKPGRKVLSLILLGSRKSMSPKRQKEILAQPTRRKLRINIHQKSGKSNCPSSGSAIKNISVAVSLPSTLPGARIGAGFRGAAQCRE